MAKEHIETIRDTTYSSLEKISDKGPKPRLAVLGQNLGTECAPVRAPYIARLDSNLAQYLYGRPDGDQYDERPTVNLTNGTINTFAAGATRVPPSIIIKSASINEKGKWVLIEPFSIPAPPGSPPGTPSRPLDLYEPIPEEVLSIVPSAYKVCIDTETVTDYYQGIFDAHRRLARMDQVVRDMIIGKQIDGWKMGIFQWDSITSRPIYHLLPAQQWFPDPTEPDVKDMAYVRLDWPLDAGKAKRLYPQIADKIDEYASRSLYFSDGSGGGYSRVYLQTYQRPVVTLTICFLRNQEAPMTLDEAVQTGMVIVSQDMQENPDVDEVLGASTAEGDKAAQSEDASAIPSDDGQDGGEESGVMADADEEEQESPDADDLASPVPGRRILHALNGVDLSQSFDGDGNPAETLHEDHPHKICTRQWVQIYEEVVEDSVCPHWDFPVWLDKNVPIPGRPFAQSEVERLRTLQRDANETHQTMVSHVSSYKGQALLIDKTMIDHVPEKLLRDGFQCDQVYVFESNGQQDFDLRKSIYPLNPPVMSPAVPEVASRIDSAYEKVAGHPGVDQGQPPPDVSSGKAILALQSQSQASAGFKSLYTEEAVYRMAMLTVHAEIQFMGPQDLYRINRKFPLPVLERYVIPYARNMVIDIDVELNTGSAQVRAENDAKVRADYSAKLLDPETARDKLRYDAEEIERRELQAQQKMAESMAAANQQHGDSQGQQGPRESVAITIPYDKAPPTVQRQIERMAGLQPATDEETSHQIAAMQAKAPAADQGQPQQPPQAPGA